MTAHRRVFLGLLLVLLSAAPAGAQSFWEAEPSPLWFAVVKDAGSLVPASYLNLTAHEMGHVAAAWVFDPGASFTYRLGKSWLPEGVATYNDDRVPVWYRPVVSAAGSALNRLLSEAADAALGTGGVPYHLQPFLAEVSLVGRTDFLSNVTNAFVLDLGRGFPDGESYNDYHNFVYLLSWDKSVLSKCLIYAGLFTLAGVDLYLSADQIRKDWDVLGGGRR